MQELEKKTKNQLIIYIIQIVMSVAIPIILIFIPTDKMSVDVKIGVLSIYLALFFLSLQFLLDIQTNEQKERIENANNSVISSFQKLEYVIKSDSMYNKILQLESGKESQYYKSLESFLSKLNKCIEDQRSGELDKTVYYDTLDNVARRIIADKDKTNFNGDIWALTFCLLKEWDENDPYEKSWFDTILKMDQTGIKTRRLWIFNNSMIKLLNSPISDDSKELLRRLKMYCSQDSKFKNTSSFALAEGNINYEDVNEFGKGFFASKYSDGSTELILGVAKDRVRTSNELCGEIDYNPIRRANIRKKWESYLKRAKPLICYLEENAHPEAKDFMKELNFKTCEANKT